MNLFQGAGISSKLCKADNFHSSISSLFVGVKLEIEDYSHTESAISCFYRF